MTTLLAILILVGFTVGMCYLAGDKYTKGNDGWPRDTTFVEKVGTGSIWMGKVCFGLVGIVAGVVGIASAVIWAIKELIGG